MCGIAGIWNWFREPAKYPEAVVDMLTLIAHRGPDEMGYYFDGLTGFGTARLCIIDLDTGQQPMADPSGQYWICFNGEVYNYLELRQALQARGREFQTESDTEVCLQAWIEWGSDGLADLNGAFAFAIYDRAGEELILARDRWGKRPLFYYQDDDRMAFASEIKSFLALDDIPVKFDKAQLATIFSTWTPLPDQSGYQNIKQVPPGSFLRFKDGRLSLQCYAHLALNPEPFRGTYEAALEETRTRLEESVRLRLRSDVEVGAYLSGGLDSSVVTQLALQLGICPRTFSIAFQNKDYDESEFQEKVAKVLGTRHTCFPITNADIVEAFPTAIWHAEVPVFRTAFVPMFLLSQQVRQQNLKVVLTGEGADEAFLGYNIFKEVLLRETWETEQDQVQQRERVRALYPYLSHYREENLDALVGVYDRFSRTGDPNLFSHELRFHNAAYTCRLLKDHPDGLEPLQAYLDSYRGSLERLNSVQKAQWLEFKTLLAGYLLSTQGDRMSLGNSVEGRCPFLDMNVVAWAGSLPQDWKLTPEFEEKNILKEAFAGRLPTEVLERPKQPYRAPDIAPFLDSRPDYLESILSENELQKIDVLDHTFCRRFLKKILNTPTNRLSPRENQTFVFLLSMALLNQFFLGRAPLERTSPPPLVRMVDGRRT